MAELDSAWVRSECDRLLAQLQDQTLTPQAKLTSFANELGQLYDKLELFEEMTAQRLITEPSPPLPPPTGTPTK